MKKIFSALVLLGSLTASQHALADTTNNYCMSLSGGTTSVCCMHTGGGWSAGACAKLAPSTSHIGVAGARPVTSKPAQVSPK